MNQIYDGADSSATLLGQWCGSDNPGIVVSSGSNLFIKFSSDSSVTYSGFSGVYMTGEAPEMPETGGESNVLSFSFFNFCFYFVEALILFTKSLG